MKNPLDNITLSNDTCVICFCLHRVIEKICRAHSGRHGAAALHKVNLLVFASASLRWPSKDRKIPHFHLRALRKIIQNGHYLEGKGMKDLALFSWADPVRLQGDRGREGCLV